MKLKIEKQKLIENIKSDKKKSDQVPFTIDKFDEMCLERTKISFAAGAEEVKDESKKKQIITMRKSVKLGSYYEDLLKEQGQNYI